MELLAVIIKLNTESDRTGECSEPFEVTTEWVLEVEQSREIRFANREFREGRWMDTTTVYRVLRVEYAVLSIGYMNSDHGQLGVRIYATHNSGAGAG